MRLYVLLALLVLVTLQVGGVRVHTSSKMSVTVWMHMPYDGFGLGFCAELSRLPHDLLTCPS